MTPACGTRCMILKSKAGSTNHVHKAHDLTFQVTTHYSTAQSVHTYA